MREQTNLGIGAMFGAIGFGGMRCRSSSLVAWPGAVFGLVWRLVWIIACNLSVAESRGGNWMTEADVASEDGAKSVFCGIIPKDSDPEHAPKNRVEAGLFGTSAQPKGNRWRDAGVHRRWQPWQLRFGLREAWCMAPSPRIGVGNGFFEGFFEKHELAMDHGAATDTPGRGRGQGHEQRGGDGRIAGIDLAVGSEILKRKEVAELAGAESKPCVGSRDGWRVGDLNGVTVDFFPATARFVISGCRLGSLARPIGADRQTCTQRVSGSGLVASRMPSATQLVQYFGEALGERPNWQGADVAVFQRTDCLQWGVSWRRGVVEVLPRGVGLRWLANDDFGLSELREFFEAPFFEAAETERFYRWFSEGGWHQEPLAGGVMLKMGVLRGRRATLVEISWRRGEAAFVP